MHLSEKESFNLSEEGQPCSGGREGPELSEMRGEDPGGLDETDSSSGGLPSRLAHLPH